MEKAQPKKKRKKDFILFRFIGLFFLHSIEKGE